MVKKRIALLTSGGDASGMNAAIRAITRYAIYKGHEVFGFYEGFKGLIENNFTHLDLNSVGGIIDRGGTFLYSARSKKFKTEKGMQEAISNLKENDIEGLIVLGGDGTFRGAHDLHQREVQVVGIPATIDNDIPGTDYSIGFDTALNVIIDLVSKIRDTASSHDRLFIIEVMGKNSGMIAINAGVACAADYVFIPEIEFDLVKVSDEIKHHRRTKRHTLLIVAEGAGNAHDIASSIKLLVGHEVRVSVLGHIQRGGSPTLLDRVPAAQFGQMAVEAVEQGKSDCMVAYQGRDIKLVELDYVFSHKREINKNLYNLASILSK
ncbi:MAG: 6-phosphofructokinase [Actinomycetota bacterium]|nr:6-phosphofructokinase [Actinomycetota bacterium]